VADGASVGIMHTGTIPFLRRQPTRPRAPLSGFRGTSGDHPGAFTWDGEVDGESGIAPGRPV
jgi:hypothetical protein